MNSPSICFDPARPAPVARVPEGLTARIVHRADQAFPFLHDTVIVPLDGRLFMAWYNCSENEIVGRTLIRGRWSEDGAQSWSEPQVVAEDRMPQHLHCVPATFEQCEEGIFAYVTLMSAHDRPVGYMRLVYEKGAWRELDRLDDPVLFNTLPVRLADGTRIAGGRMARRAGELPLIPVVLRADGEAPSAWRAVRLPGPWEQDAYPLDYPETALIVNGGRLTALCRNDHGPCWAYESEDGGQTFGAPFEISLPIEPAKLYAGVLSTGREYLIFNQRTQARDRSRLVMAARDKGGAFDSLYLLRDGADAALDAGPYWHYPCACEMDGRLYISCTSSSPGTPVRHAALISVPVGQL